MNPDKHNIQVQENQDQINKLKEQTKKLAPLVDKVLEELSKRLAL